MTDSKDIERFLRKVNKRGAGGCWIWKAALTRPSEPTPAVLPYGQFHYQGKVQGAHRVSFKMFKGEIPRGMHVMHTCTNPGCVNPEHLSLGYPDERDKIKKGHDPK
jgi:HNH endonuclease